MSSTDSAPRAATPALLRAVATRTMRLQFRLWGFGEAIALRGLLEAAQATDDAEPRSFVTGLLRASIARGIARGPEDHVAPGTELLLLYARDRDESWLQAARALARLHLGAPVGPHGVRYRRPDLPGWRRQIWVDSIDTVPPFLARLADTVGEEELAIEAGRELIGYARLLQDEATGLFVHGHEETCGKNGQHWARGNGWAVMGLVETLGLLPAASPHRMELRQRLDALVPALFRWQDPSGLWRTVIDHEETPLETTLAAMLVYALDRAERVGLAPLASGDTFRTRARAAVLAHTSEAGELALVSDATPVGELHMYDTRPLGVFPWGQGALLLMLTASP